MRTPHLLRVQLPPEVFAPLVTDARDAGLRVGWLEMEAAEPPSRLEAAAAMGVLRAVAVGARRAVAVKPLRGEAVLRDVLREHFLGCALVLVAGELDAPLLEPSGAEWVVRPPSGKPLRFGTGPLIGALRRARPFAVEPIAEV